MYISNNLLKPWLDKVSEGTWTSGKFASKILNYCIEGVSDYIMEDVIPGLLPSALIVAGSILVVTLGWRLFRNFTKG